MDFHNTGLPLGRRVWGKVRTTTDFGCHFHVSKHEAINKFVTIFGFKNTRYDLLLSSLIRKWNGIAHK